MKTLIGYKHAIGKTIKVIWEGDNQIITIYTDETYSIVTAYERDYGEGLDITYGTLEDINPSILIELKIMTSEELEIRNNKRRQEQQKEDDRRRFQEAYKKVEEHSLIFTMSDEDIDNLLKFQKDCNEAQIVGLPPKLLAALTEYVIKKAMKK